MVEHLKTLYEQTLIPDQNIVNAAAQELVVIYQNPETVVLLISLLVPSTHPSIRNAAAIGLKYTLINCWEIILQSEHFQQFLNQFIILLSNEQEYTVRHLIINALDPVFRSCCDRWGELIEFIKSLTIDPTESKYELFFTIIPSIIPYLPLEIVAPIFEFLCTQGQLALKSTSMPIIQSGARMVSELLSSISTLPQIVNTLYHEMVNALYQAMKSNQPYSTDLVSEISKIILKTDQFIEDPTILFKEIFGIILDQAISMNNKILLSELICNIIERYPQAISSVLSEVVAISLLLASQSITGDCFDQENDVMFTIRPIEYICQCVPDNDFYSVFWNNVKTDSNGAIIAAATAITSFIEHIPDLVSQNFFDFFDFAIDCIGNNDHCIKEAGFAILYQLISRNSTSFLEVFDKFFNAVFISLQCDHEPLISSVLSVIIELFYLIEIDDKYIEQIIQAFIALSQRVSLPLQYLIVTGFSAISVSAGESIPIFIQPALPILINAISCNPNEQPLIKASGIEAISYLIKYAPNETSNLRGTFFETIHQCLQMEDTSLFTSCMISLRNLSSTDMFTVDPNLLFNSIVKILQFDITTLGENNPIADSFLECKQTSLDLIKELVRYQQNLISPYIQVLHTASINLYDSKNIQVQESALKTSIAISKVVGQVHNALLVKMLEKFDDQNESIVSLAFRGFSKLIKYGIPIPQEVIKQVFETSFQGLEMELNCQIEQNIELELTNEIFGFFAAVAQYLPNIFPFEQFWNYFQAVMQEKNINRIIECIGVIVEYYAVANQAIGSIFIKTIQRNFFETLQLCDMNNPPYPIAGVRCLIETNGTIPNDQQEILAKLFESVFAIQFEGQQYYWETISSIVSLLFSVLRISGNLEGFGRFFPSALNLIPQCLSKAESDNIISSLIFFNGIPQFNVEGFQTQLTLIFAKLFSYKQRKWRKLCLQDQTVLNVKQFLIGALNNQEFANVVQSNLTNLEMNRLQIRLS
ncbi:hypothetical protein GPJ56_004684 [Histomonas meleagridis]|uniref:uncharacterized protein n=1 Tax=Histomonas meleagridis TaxID=135588 RepID=UPI00355A3DD2|nr:hypothetical protein GPJ56_004684 [Histomonas meleagridis]KAH0797445.1 hypothetical protein GO595_009766 [Histomonas meleagridis]